MEINKTNNYIKKLLENDTVTQLMDSLKTYDEYTYQHSLFVAKVSVSLGEKLHLSPQELKELSYAALLHDIGKIYIEKSLIEKSVALTEDEFESYCELFDEEERNFAYQYYKKYDSQNNI